MKVIFKQLLYSMNSSINGLFLHALISMLQLKCVQKRSSLYCQIRQSVHRQNSKFFLSIRLIKQTKESDCVVLISTIIQHTIILIYKRHKLQSTKMRPSLNVIKCLLQMFYSCGVHRYCIWCMMVHNGGHNTKSN